MIFKKAGSPRNGFYVIGPTEFPIYLVDGKKPVLFDAGLTCLGGSYVKSVNAILGKRKPKILFLTHAHFDHCGAAAILKKSFSGLTIAASSKAAHILSRPNAIEYIRRLNSEGWEGAVKTDSDEPNNENFEPFDVEHVLKGKEVIHLEDKLTVRVIPTPGHTWDFLSYYIPERKILIASEAVGCANKTGLVMTDCLVDFDEYLKSLRRLAALDVEILCQGHFFVYLDDDVDEFFKRSTRTALEFRAFLEEVWTRKNGNMASVMSQVKAIEYDPHPFPKPPESAYLINLEARIKSILKLNN